MRVDATYDDFLRREVRVAPKHGFAVQAEDVHPILLRHADAEILDAPRSFDGLRDWMTGKDIEGVVWHHPDGRMAKLKLRDFGLTRVRSGG